MTTLPAFIAFTGVDDPSLVDQMRALSIRYPIEWGILLDDAQTEKKLFPGEHERSAMLASQGLRWAAHVCGDEAERIANEPREATVDLTGFQRVQVNHSFSGSSSVQIANTVRFGRMRGVRTLLQCSTDFPDDSRLDWLFDVSFGTGVKPGAWPTLSDAGPFCGYSGGIGPSNAAAVVAAIDAPRDGLFWIDMESGVRTDDRLDLAKCEAVCRAVYG